MKPVRKKFKRQTQAFYRKDTMSQSGAVPPVHSRRHRPEMNPNTTSEPITAARFGETEWEARDVSLFVFSSRQNLNHQQQHSIYYCYDNIIFNCSMCSLKGNESWKRPELVLHKWKRP